MEGNEIINQFIQVLLPVLATFLTGVFTYIGNKIKRAYEGKVNNETAKVVVENAVKFVEQVYSNLNGPEKLQKALSEAQAILEEKGIKITQTELNMLIEAAVYGLNEGINEYKQVQELEQARIDALTESTEENVEEVEEEIEETDNEG